MNDAHIYCTQDQIKTEFLQVMNMHREIYDILDISSYYMRFSTWDPEDPKGKEKYIDNPKAWEWTQALIREAMLESGLPFIDVQFKTVTGREETASTNQVDFGVPERLGLTYIGSDNKEHHPYVIHRAPLGTHERFVAFLIEQYGGAFPTWLAPVQVRVITVSEKFNEYGEKVVARLRAKMVRAELEYSADTMGKKIRNASKQKIPNSLIIGEREQSDGTVTLRRFGQEEQTTMSVDDFERWILEKITTRSKNK
jgi:threonyl-tRNA synthetase